MKKGFTLAEIMVVLFIMTIILAAFAPLMTVRAKSTSKTSPWNWATPDSANTYFGVHPNQRVMIGQKSKGTDVANKLTINANDEQSHILFNKNGTTVGQLNLSSSNVALGNMTLPINSIGEQNTAIGRSTLRDNTTGTGNSALGVGALITNTTGNNNTAIGRWTLNNIVQGDENTAIGVGSLQLTNSGSQNTAVGRAALYSLTNNPYRNTGIGTGALNTLTNGSYNTGLGSFTFPNTTSVNYGTAVGYYSCYNITTDRTTCIGAYSGPNSTNTTSNTIYLGNTGSTVKVLGYLEAASSNISSDIRLKNIKGDYTSGLEQIKKIKPVKFTFKNDKKKTPRVGVIAQDLQKVLPKAVMKGDDGFLKIRQEDMFYAMINAIKELASKLDTVIEKQKSIEKRLQKLENNK